MLEFLILVFTQTGVLDHHLVIDGFLGSKGLKNDFGEKEKCIFFSETAQEIEVGFKSKDDCACRLILVWDQNPDEDKEIERALKPHIEKVREVYVALHESTDSKTIKDKQKKLINNLAKNRFSPEHVQDYSHIYGNGNGNTIYDALDGVFKAIADKEKYEKTLNKLCSTISNKIQKRAIDFVYQYSLKILELCKTPHGLKQARDMFVDLADELQKRHRFEKVGKLLEELQKDNQIADLLNKYVATGRDIEQIVALVTKQIEDGCRFVESGTNATIRIDSSSIDNCFFQALLYFNHLVHTGDEKESPEDIDIFEEKYIIASTGLRDSLFSIVENYLKESNADHHEAGRRFNKGEAHQRLREIKHTCENIATRLGISIYTIEKAKKQGNQSRYKDVYIALKQDLSLLRKTKGSVSGLLNELMDMNSEVDREFSDELSRIFSNYKNFFSRFNAAVSFLNKKGEDSIAKEDFIKRLINLRECAYGLVENLNKLQEGVGRVNE